MTGKLLVLVVLLAFAAMAFIAGMLAPASLQQPVQTGAQAVVGALLRAALPAAQTASSSAASAATSTAASVAATAGIGGADGAAADASAAASAPPWTQLLLPASSAAAGSRYALLAGQFASADGAQALGAQLKALGLAQQAVVVDDAQGQRWWLVAIGSYASVDAALAQRASIATQLGQTTALRVILLPAPG